jgi:RNA polymerase sigma factor (sigma-70 family)
MATGQVGTLLGHIRSLVVANHNNLLDRELLQRFVSQQEEAAFATLVQRLGPLVLGVCRRVLRHEQDAEDAFQATFLVLARKADSIRRQESLAGWLARVACHIALRAQARAGRRRAHEREAADMPQRDHRTDVAWHELREVLDKELQRLPVNYRTPLVLCCLEGRTRDEAAQEIGCSVDTVKGRLERGRELLRSRLARRGLSLSAVLVVPALAAQATSAAVPAALAAATVKGALRFRATRAAGAVAGSVAALANEALRSPFLNTLKMGVLLAVALGALALGASLIVHPEQAAGQLQAKPPDQPRAQARDAQTPASGTLTDVYGDPLPAGALARLGTVRLRHGERIYSVAFSPKHKMLATASVDQTIGLWDVATGKEIHRIKDTGYPSAVAFAPDGKTLAWGCHSGVLRLWDVVTGTDLGPLGKAGAAVDAIAFSPDGTLVAAVGRENAIRLWELATGKERSLVGPGHACAVAFSPDGKYLASGTQDGAVTLWEMATGNEVAQFVTQGLVGGMAFSPDSKCLAAGSADKTIHLWDVATGKAVGQLQGHGTWVRGVAFTPDGKNLVSSGSYDDSTVRVWERATLKELRTFQCEAGDCEAFALSGDGKTVAVAGSTNLVRLWDVATGKDLHRPEGHLDALVSLAYSPDGKTLVSLASSDRVRVWETASGKQIGALGWKVTQGKALSLSADGKTVATADLFTNTIRIGATATGKQLRTLTGCPKDPVWSVAFSPDGKLLATGGVAGAVHLWDSGTGEEVRQLRPPHAGFATSVAFAPDGQTLAAGGLANSIQVWTLDGKERARFHSSSTTTALAISPDGQTVATAESDGTLRLWDVAKGQERIAVPRQHPALRSVAFSPDGRTLVSGGDDNSVVLWDALTGQELVRFVGHHGYVWSVAFSPDGRSVVSASHDTTGLVWDVTGRCKQGRLEAVNLTPSELETCWASLCGKDAPKAHRALWTLVAAPKQTLTFLKSRLLMPAPDAKLIDRLLGELDDDQFKVRDKATRELAALGKAAEAALRKALEGRPSLELRRRVDTLLDKLGEAATSRHARVASVLEQIGTPDACRLLESLALDAAEANLRQEAKASLARLSKRGAS